MPNNRDDFTQKTIRIMYERVGLLCSYPNCRRLTKGPNSDDSKSTCIGVAAHITAASPGGPRYDPSLTPKERKSISNGIWLCENHAKLIDSDSPQYTVEIINSWKSDTEKYVEDLLVNGSQYTINTEAISVKKAVITDLNKQKSILNSYIAYYNANKGKCIKYGKTVGKPPIIPMDIQIPISTDFWDNNTILIAKYFDDYEYDVLENIYKKLFGFSKSGFNLVNLIKKTLDQIKTFLEA